MQCGTKLRLSTSLRSYPKYAGSNPASRANAGVAQLVEAEDFLQSEIIAAALE